MAAISTNRNGHAKQSASDPLTTLLNLGRGEEDDVHLFQLFATLAKEAGRDDLHEEFLQRSTGVQPRPFPTTPAPSISPEADLLQKNGCRSLSAGKLKEAEAEFRKAIKLDPKCADAHGNLGVAFAQQKKLPQAEAAFNLSIRFNPTNVTMYVNLATCLNQQKSTK